MRHINYSAAWLYKPIRKISMLSYGIYLMHIFLLGFMQQWIAPHLTVLPAILAVGSATFLGCIAVSLLISRLPGSRWIIG